MPGRIRIPAKRSKYRAVRTTVGNITFASKKEAARYVVLRALEDAGKISELQIQTRFTLLVNAVRIGFYHADFVYFEGGEMVVEDVKGMKTPAYRIKAKLMLAIHGIAIRET